MKIGEIIKELRFSNNLTQQTVADKIGISRSVLSQYENNLVEPTANVVKKFAAYFEVSSDYLLGLENDYGARVPATTAAPMGEFALPFDEKKLLEVYRNLSPDMRGTLWSLLNTWSPEVNVTTKNHKK